MNTDESCVFCRIARFEEPAEVVAYWFDAVAIVPLNPVTPGHVLIIPETHVTDFADNPEVSGTAMRRAAHYCKDRGIESANLITSKGSAATQTIGHLHLHIVPRRDGDGLALPWTGSNA